MSYYMEYTIERKNDEDKWVCINQSYSDDKLNVIDPYIIKSLFYDTDCYNVDKTEITEESWFKFTSKIELYESDDKNYPYHYPYQYEHVPANRPTDNSLDYLEQLYKTKYRHNDVYLWFDFDQILDYKNMLFQLLRFTDMESYKKFRSDVSKEELKKYITHADNVTFQDNRLGILYQDTIYNLIQLIKYNKDFKDFNKLNPGISSVNYFNKDGDVKQYEYDYKISDKDDIQRILDGVTRDIKQYQTNNAADNIAKIAVNSILTVFEWEESEDTDTKLYKRLKEYVKDCNDYDYDYLDELILQQKELEKLLMIVGEGRLVWNIWW